MPVKAWTRSMPASRRLRAGSPCSRINTSGTRMSEARPNRSPPIRKIGTLATTSLPTTTELPTMAMAAESSSAARRRWAGEPIGSRARGCARGLGGALDLIAELAEGADGAGGHLPASGALVQVHGLRPLECHARLVQEAEQEVVLGARRGVLQPAEDLLVHDGGRALRERALLHDVVDPAQEGVRRGLALGEPVERLHPPHQLGVGGGQHGRL